jgi:hypothetical protein
MNNLQPITELWVAPSFRVSSDRSQAMEMKGPCKAWNDGTVLPSPPPLGTCRCCRRLPRAPSPRRRADIYTMTNVKTDGACGLVFVLRGPVVRCWGLGSNGTVNRFQDPACLADHISVAVRSGRSSPRATASDTAKEYRPSILACS